MAAATPTPASCIRSRPNRDGWSPGPRVAKAAGTRDHPRAQGNRVAKRVRGQRHWWLDNAPDERGNYATGIRVRSLPLTLVTLLV
jgi:hypothetical protein